MNKINFSAMCKRCLMRNGQCIKDEPYIGLCAQNDKEELLFLRKVKKI